MIPNQHLILVKHSSPKIIEDVPAREWKLSDEGRDRAQKLVEKLKKYRLNEIFSSDEPKAQQTAEIISGALGLENYVMAGLHEQVREGVLFSSYEEFQKKVESVFEQPDELVFGNETANQALDRFRKSVDLVLGSSNAETVLIVAHGTVISLYVSWLTGINGYSIWQKLGLPSFVVLDMRSKTLLRTENIS